MDKVFADREHAADDLEALADELDDEAPTIIAARLREAARLLRAEALTDRQRQDAEAMAELRAAQELSGALITLRAGYHAAVDGDGTRRFGETICDDDPAEMIRLIAGQIAKDNADPAAAVMAAAQALKKGAATE